MKNMRLTKYGAALLNGNLGDGESRYWIGYYGLAYVPDKEHDSLDNAAQTGELTTTGDYIFNIWQGDMLNGYAQANPETSASTSLFGLTMYDKSIRTNYRYVYHNAVSSEDTSYNQLVTWKSVPNGNGENTLERVGAYIYKGVNGENNSEIPLPAPLYYKSSELQVSGDYRYYVGVNVSDPDLGWNGSTETWDEEYATQAQLDSISNFNKFHGTVSSEGYGVSSVSSCHNMSKATKLFPISHYTVINDNGKKLAETYAPDNSSAKKPLASAIKYSIDLSPVSSDRGYTALNYREPDNSDAQDRDSVDFLGKYTSFCFNRIGIYAVPMTAHRYSAFTETDDCNAQKVQFEIDGDAEPVLVAVADINDIIISDDPQSGEGGIAKFSLEFSIKFPEDTDGQIERRTAIYYNLYENDATTWYKNQLLASASMSEAVTDLSLELNAMKQQINDGGECCNQDLDLSRYAPKNHTHDYLKNLVDGVDKAGSVRGIYTCEEGDGSNIPAVFGLINNSPTGVKKSCIMHSFSTMVDGAELEMPDSYLYCVGLVDYNSAPNIQSLTFQEIEGIISVYGAEWFRDKIATDVGYGDSANTQVINDNHIYVWENRNQLKYVVIDLTTGIVTEETTTSATTRKFLGITRTDAIPESLFADGYSAGVDSLVLGDDTAGAGDYSVIQGNMVYSDGAFSTILGSEIVRAENSDHMSILGAVGMDIKDSKYSILFGNCDVDAATAHLYPVTLHDVDHAIIGAMGRMNLDDTVDASVMIGRISAAHSIRNSLILSDTQSTEPLRYGLIDDSILLDSVYSVDHRESLDESINVDKSISIYNSLHSYYNENEEEWYLYKGGTVEGRPAMECTVAVGARVYKPTRRTMVIANGDFNVGGPFRVNSELRPATSGINGVTNSLLIGTGEVGNHSQSTVAIGAYNFVPNASDSTIMVGTYNGIRELNDDNVKTREGFNQARANGTLIPDSHYVVIGDGNLDVWDEGTQSWTTYTLTGSEDHIYGGIYVDADGHVTIDGTLDDRLNPAPLKTTFILGNNNTIFSRGTNGLCVIGEGNESSYVTLTNVSVFGDDNSLDGYDANSEPRASYASLSNVHIFGNHISLGLSSRFQVATHSYSDALVMLGSGYAGETMGIYGYSAYRLFGIDDAMFTGPDDTYDDVGSPFYGKTRGEVSAMVTKPNAPMIYTGGITLAGLPSAELSSDTPDYSDNFGLIKIGNMSKPWSEIGDIDVLADEDDSTLIHPVSVTGTTSCPFGGMVLAVDHKQELDGTMHLVLSRGARNIVSLYDTDGTTLRVLKDLQDDEENEWTMPENTDFMEQLAEILGSDHSPVIRFRLNTVDSHCECYGHLCKVGYCAYLFSADITAESPAIESQKRYICVRYDNTATASTGVKVTVSDWANDRIIELGTGLFYTPSNNNEP